MGSKQGREGFFLAEGLGQGIAMYVEIGPQGVAFNFLGCKMIGNDFFPFYNITL